MSESIEAQLEAARRLLPTAPARSRGRQLFLLWLGLVILFVVAFEIFNQRAAWEARTRQRAAPGATDR
jgi:hypothetical protein